MTRFAHTSPCSHRPGYINDLASGALCVSLGWNGDMSISKRRAEEAKNGIKIQVLLPKTGAILFFDTMAIPADAQHVENAYKWMSSSIVRKLTQES